MTKSNNYTAAIDIGTTKIVTLVGKKNDDNKIEILGLSTTPSTGVKRGVVLNIEETVNAINKTVEEIESTTGIKLSQVLVGIAGQHIRSIRNRGYINRDSYEDEVTREDIENLVNDMYKIPIDAGEEIIHVLPQNFIVDNEIGVKNPVGMSGKRLEANFHIVIAKIASAKNIEKCVNRIGLKINSLVLEPLASSEAVLTDDEKEAGVTLVDIGGGTTDIAVYYDDIIRHTAVIPFGGNVVTSDIKEGCSILQKQAENLKIQYGSAIADSSYNDDFISVPGISGREPKEISFTNLASIIQARMEEIIDAIMFEIENSGVHDKLSAGIVLTGGGSMLRHLPQLFKYKTGMDVRIGIPNEGLSSNTNEDFLQPRFATSIGLIHKGITDLPIVEEEVINEEKLEQEETIEEETQEKEEKTDKQKKNFFDSLKNQFTKMFDEGDMEM